MANIVAGQDKPCTQQGCRGHLVVSFAKTPDGDDGYRVECDQCGFVPADGLGPYTADEIMGKNAAHKLNLALS